MKDKILRLEEFNQLKEIMKSIIDEGIKKVSENPENEQEIEEQILQQYTLFQNLMLSHDLSEISYEAYNDLRLIGDIDFSGTKANIDFNILSLDDVESIKVHGCKVKNVDKIHFYILNEESFDEQQQAENPNLFLSHNIPKDFRAKYYQNKLTMDDFLSLTEEQLTEIEEKGCYKGNNGDHEHITFYRAANVKTNTMIKMLGIPKAVKLYKEKRADFEEMAALFFLNSPRLEINYSHYNFINDQTSEILRNNQSIESLKENLYQIIRKELLSEYHPKLRVEQFTPDFLEANEDIFLLHQPLPSEVREKYYSRELSYEDLEENINCFKNSRYSIELEDNTISSFVKKVGEEKFLYLLEKHKDIFDYIHSTPFGFSKLEGYIPDFETIVEDFPIIISKYIRNNNSTELLYKKHQLPEWASSMNYKVMPDINTIEDLLQVDNHTFIINESQAEFVGLLGVKNLLRFEKESGCMRNSNINVYTFMTEITKQLPSYNKLKIVKEYNEFLNIIFKAFNKMRKKSYHIPIYKGIEGPMREKNKALFVDDSIPKELQEAFYENSINLAMLKKYRQYIPKLLGKNFYISGDFEVTAQDKTIDFQEYYIEQFGQEKFINLLLKYGVNATKMNKNINYNLSDEEKQMEEEIKKSIYQNILESNQPYYNDSPETHALKEFFPLLFLPENTPDEIKELFYSRKITREDLMKRKDLVKYFENTSIVFGLEKHREFLSQLYNDINIQEANERRINIYNYLCSIDEDVAVLNVIEEYIKNNEYDIEKIEKAITIANRIVHSNSKDIRNLACSILSNIIDKENTEESLAKIESVFTQNNLPFFVKVYSCFQILNPNLESFDLTNNNSIMAPELKDNNLPSIGKGLTPIETRMQIIFNDILRVTCHSNNRDLTNYLDNLEIGTKYYNEITKGNTQTRVLSKEETDELTTFAEHLETLYRHTKAGKESKLNFTTMPLNQKIKILGDLFQPTKTYDLKDRIVRSFAYYAGIDSFEQLKNLAVTSLIEADKRGRDYAKELEERKFQFEVGDFIRCIGNYQSLGGSLEYGNFSKEFLTPLAGKTVDSDSTPLDIDLTLITQEKDIYHSVEGTPTGFGFGNIYMILKKDNPILQRTRDKEGNEIECKYDPSKSEIFRTGFENHWGVRTGIGFTDVDYIMYKKNMEIDPTNPYDENGNVNYIPSSNRNKNAYNDLPAIKFEIARNGFYIPVIDFSGKLIFTPKEYEDIRTKMQGLSHYGINEYQLSQNLSTKEIAATAEEIPANSVENAKKKEVISATIKKALSPLGLEVKEEMERKLTTGTVEFIDTGSTARNTNIIGQGDFDYIMRLDNSIISDHEQFQKLKDRLIEVLGEEHRNEIVNGNFRFKNVKIEGLDQPIDIDISFIEKTDKIEYSSDQALKDRLHTIQTEHQEQYNVILANIIEAKKTLKEGDVYKKQQGGISGIGIENWILQNRGSFLDAAQSFLDASEGKSVEEFKETYSIWDFGENHYSDEENIYHYDNFITNLTAEGYQKMKTTLSKYISKAHDKTELDAMLNDSTSKTTAVRENMSSVTSLNH